MEISQQHGVHKRDDGEKNKMPAAALTARSFTTATL
jgi:hypothetical protein